MQRRSFLASILAAGVAPALVRNPMKIFVPKPEIWVPMTPEDIMGQILQRLHDQVAKAYMDSGYLAAALSLSGGSCATPERILTTDTTLREYLQEA